MASAALTVDLNARIAQFETELKKATGSLDKFGKKGDQIAAGFKTAFGALATSVSVGMFVGFIKSSIDAQDAISKLSQKTGIAVESLAGLQHAADLSDVGVDQLAKGIRTFGVVVDESARGMKSYQDKLTMLGLDYKKLKDLSPEEQFYALADAVKSLGKEDRAVAVSGALGDRLSALVPLLSGGADELRKMVEEGKKYNPVTEESARLAEEFNDNLTRLKASAGAAGVSIATDLLPSLAKTADRVRELMDDDKGVQALVRAFAGLGKIPFDLIFGDIQAATTAQGRIKELKEELNGLQRDLKSSQSGGKSSLLMRSIFGTPEEINQQITIIKNQITALEKFGDKVYKPKAKPGADATPNKPTTTPTTTGSKADPQGAFVAKLKREAETLGLSGEALQRYEALKLRLTGSNKKLADSYISQIAAFKEQQEAAKANNEAFDEAIKKQDALDAALESSIKSVREWIAEQEFEVSLIGLTNTERETAIQLRALETAGIDTQTESYKKLAEQVAAANADKRGISLLSGTQTEKTKEFLTDIDALNKLFFDGKVGAEQYAEGIDLITGSTEKAQKEMDTFAETAAKNIQNSMADFLFDPFDKGLNGMLQGFGQMLQKMIAEAVAADLAKKLFGGLTDGGKTGGSGLVGAGLDWLGGLFGTGSANGNAFSASGVKLSGFATGGVASGPASGYPVLMHGTEAILPLKRGSNGKLGVEGGGGGSTIIVNVNGSNNAPDVRRAAGQGAREALGMINGAKRYA